jgi:hypothetical protein
MVSPSLYGQFISGMNTGKSLSPALTKEIIASYNYYGVHIEVNQIEISGV